MSTKPRLVVRSATRPTFTSLVSSIRAVDGHLAAQAGRAVNIALTLRNWLIGAHIAEYELKGADRAKYGEQLLDKLSLKLQSLGVSACGRRQLYHYLRFHQTYPRIVRSVTPQFLPLLPGAPPPPVKVRSATAQSAPGSLPLLQRLAYTHIEQLVALDDPAARAFYETECIRGCWSVRELKRQIASLYYERSALSRDKAKLAARARRGAEQTPARLDVKDPYVFEFLGLQPREVMSESHLEDQLLDKLQDFLLELGHGFCFEARQKRILIGDTHGFVDLVFYHRILKCHVLVDLKLEPFTHENIGQLNTYVTWYRRHMMQKGDNPPVGLLLCAQKDHALAEYALAGMDNRLFVSKYQLHLPKPAQLRRRIERALMEHTS
jgi:predicted nuclease of restriction endonuclease-like (RecB) superfamily